MATCPVAAEVGLFSTRRPVWRHLAITPEELVRWYRENAPAHESLAKKCEAVIREVLEIERIAFQDVTSRLKSLDSFISKAAAYEDPTSEIYDLAGVRVIAYVESEARRIAEEVRKLFDIDTRHSVDKTATLGIDRVGYRSVHFVATLPADRTQLHEYRRFSGMSVEIQIRTLLQHAWAEIEHDRRYKYAGTLPNDLQRRFKLVAAQLETADREFDALDDAVRRYGKRVAKQLASSPTDSRSAIPVNSITLRQFIQDRFPATIAQRGVDPDYVEGGDVTRVVRDLESFGISTLEALDQILPTDFDETVSKAGLVGTHLIDLVPVLLVITDAARYFAGQSTSLTVVDADMAKVLGAYGVDADELARRYSLMWIPF